MYPTKEEILKKRPAIRTDTKNVIKKWKSKNYKGWKDIKKSEKNKRLKKLIKLISKAEKKPSPKIKFRDIAAYNPKKKTIILQTKKPSIVSTLHELGHHIFGAKELTTCRWSIWIFKEVFTRSYAQLSWEGHLLIKK